MELIKKESRYIVETHVSDFGYEDDHSYTFDSEEMMIKFLTGNWDNDCIDIFGDIQCIGSEEYPTRIYEETEYEQRYDWEDE